MCVFINSKPYSFVPYPTGGHTTMLSYAIVTDVGNVRVNNEDAALACIAQSRRGIAARGHLFILADGMGGHNSGEVASDMALKIFSTTYFRRSGSVKKALQKAVQKTNAAIYKASCREAALKGMGTTLTAIAIQHEKITLAHIGDSRCYLLKKEKIVQLSTDHTWVQHLLQEGQIKEADIKNHPQRNVLVKALGIHPTAAADVLVIDTPFEPEDALLLCSDGLYEYVTPDEIIQYKQAANSLQHWAESLTALAKERGGHDNITVLAIATLEQKATDPLKVTQEYTIYTNKK